MCERAESPYHQANFMISPVLDEDCRWRVKVGEGEPGLAGRSISKRNRSQRCGLVQMGRILTLRVRPFPRQRPEIDRLWPERIVEIDMSLLHIYYITFFFSSRWYLRWICKPRASSFSEDTPQLASAHHSFRRRFNSDAGTLMPLHGSCRYLFSHS